MKTAICSAITAVVIAGCCTAPKCCFNPADPVVGNWGLKFDYPDMNAGHIIIWRDADGIAKGLCLWRWGSPVEMNSVEIDGNKFVIDHPWGWRIEGSVMGCGTLDAVAYNKEGGAVETRVVGWRNPPTCDKASTKDAKFGEPIDMLADGLDGWVAMDPNAKFGWSIKEENGVKILSNYLGLKEDGSWAGGGCNLMSKHADFFDFNLDYDVRVPKDSNSGVYLRGRYEIQVIDSFGKPVDCHNMAAYYGRVTPTVAAEKPAGEWQHVNVTLYKRHLTVVLNGVTIIDDAPITGITGGAIDANEVVPGPIYLQGDHSDADYKNMILRPAIN